MTDSPIIPMTCALHADLMGLGVSRAHLKMCQDVGVRGRSVNPGFYKRCYIGYKEKKRLLGEEKRAGMTPPPGP